MFTECKLAAVTFPFVAPITGMFAYLLRCPLLTLPDGRERPLSGAEIVREGNWQSIITIPLLYLPFVVVTRYGVRVRPREERRE